MRCLRHQFYYTFFFVYFILVSPENILTLSSKLIINI